MIILTMLYYIQYNGRTTDLTIKIVTTKISKKKAKNPIEKLFL